ncbi:hypothetical protein EC912_103209 [Luteibacter rhizovicinus]|uniref:Uncharacterized protein n=1 Tax=Luteibacter rhizovicinus TaxID=242606 RepID=A0A4R3YTQ9_9GAMM|nr:hypothetical protein EC912_103209 [Luteibacter rhizovicinus]
MAAWVISTTVSVAWTHANAWPNDDEVHGSVRALRFGGGGGGATAIADGCALRR